MKILSKEKVKVVAEKNGWSLAYAEGHIDGEIFRRRGKPLSTYAQIGIDEYCLGFRAGYYERQSVASKASFPGRPVVRLPLRMSRDSTEAVDATTIPAHSG